jgi:AMP-activated protein kinase-like protein
MIQEFDPQGKPRPGEREASDLPPSLLSEVVAARRPVSFSSQLEVRVMAVVRRRAASRRHRAWQWLTAPSVPPWALLAAAAALIVAFVLLRPASVGSSGAASPLAAAAGPESVYVRFILVAPNARQVALAGTFNGWDPSAAPLVRAGAEGTWTVTVALPVGQHQYAFIVDGRRWVPDPAAPAVDDGFGRQNSVVSVSAAQGRVL